MKVSLGASCPYGTRHDAARPERRYDTNAALQSVRLNGPQMVSSVIRYLGFANHQLPWQDPKHNTASLEGCKPYVSEIETRKSIG
jgi:hypothetical protein